MKGTLLIDTSESDRIRVGLRREGKDVWIEEPMTREKAQRVLPLIEDLLKTQQLSLLDIKEIKVNTGPGSFTGLRVGLAIANMLGTILHVPINGSPPGHVQPRYSPSKLD